MQGMAIRFRVHGNGFYAEIFAGTNHPQCDFATVCN
jgi:hypothetical protein